MKLQTIIEILTTINYDKEVTDFMTDSTAIDSLSTFMKLNNIEFNEINDESFLMIFEGLLCVNDQSADNSSGELLIICFENFTNWKNLPISSEEYNT